MPSYYDSTKKKPGKAKLKYNEGGVLGRALGKRAFGATITDAEKKRLNDLIKDEIIRKSLGAASTDAEKSLLKKMSKGGKVKKMKGGGTVARGSGAARPQAFHKNG